MNDGEGPPKPAAERSGRIVALDLGERRIGVAVSDETQTVARSLTVLERMSRLTDFERIGRIVDDYDATLLIVGLPLMVSGEEGEKAAWVRDYCGDLQQQLEVPIQLWDESYTTVQAEASLRERGIHGRKRRKRVDAVAAAFILQSYLDAQTRMHQDDRLA